MNSILKNLVFAALLFTLATVGCNSQRDCSPCQPGKHAQDPAQSCSQCVPDGDGGADADAGQTTNPGEDSDATDGFGDGDGHDGVDGLTDVDGSIDQSCGGYHILSCNQIVRQSGGRFICGDVGQHSFCSNGQWQCPEGTIDLYRCACSGPVCNDAGTDADRAATDADGAGTDADGAATDAGG